MGRPKLKSGQAKSVVISLRLTNEEAKQMADEADRRGKTVPEWMRFVLRMAAMKSWP